MKRDIRPFIDAVVHLDLETVLRELKAGVDINQCEEASGVTALHYAVMGKNEVLVELLLQNGARVNAMTQRGETPLDIAMDLNCQTIVALIAGEGGMSGKYLCNPARKAKRIKIEKMA